MVVAGSDAVVNAIVAAAVIAGPLVAIAIFWFGLRHARKHDEQNR